MTVESRDALIRKLPTVEVERECTENNISSIDASVGNGQTRACVASQLLNMLIIRAVVHMDTLQI